MKRQQAAAATIEAPLDIEELVDAPRDVVDLISSDEEEEEEEQQSTSTTTTAVEPPTKRAMKQVTLTGGQVSNGGEVTKKCEVISCSRRSDVPAFKLDWVMACIKAGVVEVCNPRNPKQKSVVSLSPKVVKCWAWWSKDYNNWITAWKAGGPEHDLLAQFDSHIFNFTINTPSDDLERGVKSSLDQRLEQLAWLVEQFGANSVVLRFDPIVHYRKQGETTVRNNLGSFEKIMERAGQLGITTVAVAFNCVYSGVKSRMLNKFGLEPVELSLANKKDILQKTLMPVAKKHGVELKSCCQPELEIAHSSCIGGDQISRVLRAQGKAGLTKPDERDKGQRYPKCHCVKSVDIGGYGKEFACQHSCAYCYANPV